MAAFLLVVDTKVKASSESGEILGSCVTWCNLCRMSVKRGVLWVNSTVLSASLKDHEHPISRDISMYYNTDFTVQ